MPQLDKTKLVKKKVVDRTGKERTVWVKPFEAVKRKVGKVKEEFKEARRKSQLDYDHAKTFTDKTKVFFKNKSKAMVSQIKKEIKEWKTAGAGFKQLFTGKKPSAEQGKAMAVVALHTAFVLGVAAVGAASAGAFATKAALGYIEHAGILRGGAALVFNKAEQEGLTDEEAMDRFVREFIEYIHDNNLTKDARSESKTAQQAK